MAKVPPWVWSGDSARLLTQNILVSGVTVSATELGYLDGVTSAIQTQIDSKTGIADNETITGNWTFNNIITGSITGNAGTVTNGVYTTGDQSIAGIKTFSSTIVGSISGNAGTVTNGAYINVTNSFTSTQNILATTNQLVLGTTNTTTISATAPSASRVYTIPDAGGAADFVLTAGTQTITGTKTLSDTVKANWQPLILQSGGTSKLYFSGLTNVADNRIILSHNYSRDAANTFSADDLSEGVAGISFDNGTISLLTEAAGQTTASTRVFVDAAGYVGINDSTPENRLTIVIDSSDEAVVKSRTSVVNGTASYQIGNDADNWFMGIDGGNSDRFFIGGTVNNTEDYLTISTAGAVTLGPSSGFAGVLTHTFNGSIKIKGNIPSSAYEANTFLIDNNIGTVRLFAVGPNTSTRGTLEFRITSSNNSLPALAGSIATTTAWVIGGTGNTALHNLNTAALTTSTAAGISYLRIQINGATRRIPTYNDA